MRLPDLLADPTLPSVEITGIAADSREVRPGYLYVAIPGTKTDGAAFIPDAIANGAAAVISSPRRGEAGWGAFSATSEQARPRPNPPPAGEGVAFIAHPNPRLALSQLAARFYPRQPKHLVAVTGTDGKTSTADFFRQLCELTGHKAASIGTLGVLGANRQEIAPGGNTTPDPVALHRLLQRLADENYTHAALEASSHGLDQYRLHGVRLQAAAFTNLTRDHLDYHGTEAAYFAAKARLFSDFPIETAVLNADDSHSETLRAPRVWTFGRNGTELRILDQRPTPEGQEAALSVFGQKHALSLPHVGAFQLYNMLAALGLFAAVGGDAQAAVALLPKLEGVPGRLQRAGTLANGAAVYVDYAHTPAALANVLKTLRPHTRGKLHAVFGCGGDRDKGKRPLMGKAAAEFADGVTVTDDNPRGEDPAAIRAEVLAGCAEKSHVKEVADRKTAIYGAVAALAAGDILLVAGKGHETGQIVGDVTHPFNDAEVVKQMTSSSGLTRGSQAFARTERDPRVKPEDDE